MVDPAGRIKSDQENHGLVSIETTRFGTIEVKEKRIIRFPEGILGFPNQRRFTILEHKPNSPFCWLQSLDDPALAFVMTSPFLIDPDYLKGLGRSFEEILEGIRDGKNAVFVLVTIPPGEVEEMTANLLGPIVIDIPERTGRQLVLANSTYSPRHPLKEFLS